MKQVNEKLDHELQEIKNAGTWKAERVITSQQDVEITVDGSEGKILNFCANNYLGLSVSFMPGFVWKKKLVSWLCNVLTIIDVPAGTCCCILTRRI